MSVDNWLTAPRAPQTDTSKPLRLALVGCGAVTIRKHAPAAAARSDVAVTAVIDPNPDQAALAASKAHAPRARIAARLEDALDSFDAAILAAPTGLHESVGDALLAAGKHVLMEKPLAASVAACDRLVAVAARSKAKLHVALMRRFLPAFDLVRSLLVEGAIGRLESFDFEEGGVFGWPVASPALFDPRLSGGGVLMDTGAHTVDTALAWLGDLSVVDYSDDAEGGVEADCRATLRTAEGVEGTLALSRLRNLRNTMRLMGERGTLEVDVLANRVVWTNSGGATALIGGAGDPRRAVSENAAAPDPFARQLDAWLSELGETPAPVASMVGALATAEDGRRVVEVIEACYAAKRLERPSWRFAPAQPSPAAAVAPERDLAGARVLLVGGAGFVGTRLAEMLAERHGAEVTILGRSFTRAVQIARRPICILKGDLLDRASLDSAFAGQDFVVDCATPPRGLGAEGARDRTLAAENLVGAAAGAGVRRLVHFSSVVAYGDPADGPLTEDSRAGDFSNPYGLAKAEVEAAVFAAAARAGISTTVLQPTVIYGPGSPWAAGLIAQLRGAPVLLPALGAGLCNPVHVEDVAASAIAALTAPAAAGRRYLISDGAPERWDRFYDRFIAFLGRGEIQRVETASLLREIEMRRRERSAWRQFVSRFRADPTYRQVVLGLPGVASARALAEAVMPNRAQISLKRRLTAAPAAEGCEAPPPRSRAYAPPKFQALVLAARQHVQIDRARSELGFAPTVRLDEGLAQTFDWARWANV